MKAIVGGNLIDGTGTAVLPDGTVLIDGERIVEVGPTAAVTVPPDAEIVDASGMTVMPGLIDCHDHLASESYDILSRWGLDDPASLRYLRTASILEDTLASGYTSVRDGSGLDAGFKMAIEEGVIDGPRLMLSINLISPTGGLSDRVSPSGHRNSLYADPRMPSGVGNGPAGVRERVREMIRAGADVIKFATTGGASTRPGHGPRDAAFEEDEIEAIVSQAASQGKKTMCHAIAGPGLRMAVQADVGSIEHGCYLSETPDLIHLMADTNTFFVPTLMVYEYHSTVSPPYMRERALELADAHRLSIEMALSMGVKVVAGTDAGGFVHGDNAREIELLVEAGLTNMQAIQAATGWAAECIGLDADTGTLEPGKYADLLVLDGDPLSEIGVLRDRDRLKLGLKGGDAFVDRMGGA
ncbi:MAG: amidohydrolase family protein [Chloroflexi bacterium]|nr:amidohydrolase family protein [Chloroflexota bacterium]MBT4513707.1 amidohydrolase family protein [Chloroflexota bacterium]MBT5319222.1 amidohydrolase family protein [Chloroflexota bacterium]MBT6682720.1 amidohydrolase family protein [Chloroflexota bacterium]